MRKMIAIPSLFLLAAIAAACSGKMSFNTTPSGATTTGSNNQGGGSSRESLTEQDLAVVEDIVAALTPINNQNDLNAAQPKLLGLIQKHKDIKEEEKKLGPATAQEQDALRRKYGDRAKAAKVRLSQEMVRISRLPNAQELYHQLAEVNNSL